MPYSSTCNSAKKRRLGTCLCLTCTNPQLKVNALHATGLFEKKHYIKDDVITNKTYCVLGKKVEGIVDNNADTGIQCTKWIKVVNPLSKKNWNFTKIPLRVTNCAMITTLCSMLIKEINNLKSHLHCALMQLKALKAVQEEANGSSANVITIPIDLSDKRMQSL